MQEHSGWSAQPTFSLGASLIFPACAQLSLLLSCIIACLILWWFWCSSSYSHEVFRLSICPPQVAKQLSKRLSWKSLGTHMLLNHTHNVSTTSKCWWGKWQEFLAGEDNTVRFIDSLMGLKLHNYTNLSCDSFSLEKGFTPSEGPECTTVYCWEGSVCHSLCTYIRHSAIELTSVGLTLAHPFTSNRASAGLQTFLTLGNNV